MNEKPVPSINNMSRLAETPESLLCTQEDLACRKHEAIFLMKRLVVRPFLEFHSVWTTPSLERNVKTWRGFRGQLQR